MPNRPATSVPIPIPIVHIDIYAILSNNVYEKCACPYLEVESEQFITIRI